MKVPFLDMKRGYAPIMHELTQAYDRVIDSGNFILGPEVGKFEKHFASYCQAKYCVGVASGLDALTLSLMALNLKPGDEVIVPANTYIATWIAVSRAGLKPVPVDADPKTNQINADLIEDAITERTRVLMPVHLYYQPCDIDRVNEIATSHSLKVISDAAQAHGMKYRGKTIGSQFLAECFSFYPTKNLGAFGDGGAITTNDPDLYDRLLMLRNYGTKQKYISEIKGFNSRLDELQAAFLSVKIKYLDNWNNMRRTAALQYLSLLEDSRILLPMVSDFAIPNWHIFPILSGHRNTIKEKLYKKGVDTIIHYPVPPFLQPAYRDEGYNSNMYPVSAKIANEILSLPIYPYITEEEVNYVSETIKITLIEL